LADLRKPVEKSDRKIKSDKAFSWSVLSYDPVDKEVFIDIKFANSASISFDSGIDILEVKVCRNWNKKLFSRDYNKFDEAENCRRRIEVLPT